MFRRSKNPHSRTLAAQCINDLIDYIFNIYIIYEKLIEFSGQKSKHKP
jgi:uncharacterized membrane protein YpjA